MENVQKYFAIIEHLNKNGASGEVEKRLKLNIDIIGKYIKLDKCSLIETRSLKCINYTAEELVLEDPAWSYSTLLFHILLTISQEVDLNSTNADELISLAQQDLFTNFVIEASKYAICSNIISEMQNHQIFKLDLSQKKFNLNRLLICLRFIEKICKVNFLVGGSKINQVKLESMAAAVSILSCSEQNADNAKNFLGYLYNKFCKVNYFKNLLVLKSIPKLPENVQKILHEDLLDKLQGPTGFKILLESIIPSANVKAPNWKCFEVISNIVSHKGHSEKFCKNLINQIYIFLKMASENKLHHAYIPAGVLSLRKLYLLNVNTKVKVEEKIDEVFRKLYNPEDVIAGVILFESDEFENLLKFLNFLFCGSSFQSLPAEILIPYLPLLIQCYDQIPNNFKQAELIKALVIQCLMNRHKDELKLLLRILIFEEIENNYKVLHERIFVNLSENSKVENLQICSSQINNRNHNFVSLCRLLKSSNNNILVYNSFMSVLDLFDEKFCFERSNIDSSFLESEEELEIFIGKNYKSIFAVVSFLTDLIEFKPLHSQFKENPSEILDFIKSILQKSIDCNYFHEEKLSIILAIFQEVVESVEDSSKFQHFTSLIRKLLMHCQKNLKYQLEHILNILEGNTSNGNKKTKLFGKSDYEIARNLIEENQPYLKVYGITLMVKLINQKDLETINNKHSILAMALHVIKDEESYVFLNCVKLFVTLINSLEADVLNVLSDEYLSDNNDCDYRLKIGEAILKVTEDLGAVSYKYKNILINCFLNGSRHPINEVRMSSISNLATICKLLTYQVHNFFQELLLLVESILQTDKYLPVRRAAILVLVQLLSGMNNLLDFQEYLLPVYRILKFIAANESDSVMQIHANNGLKILTMKCKNLLLNEKNLEKEIKIFGLKDDTKKKKSNYIVEIN